MPAPGLRGWGSPARRLSSSRKSGPFIALSWEYKTSAVQQILGIELSLNLLHDIGRRAKSAPCRLSRQFLWPAARQHDHVAAALSRGRLQLADQYFRQFVGFDLPKSCNDDAISG